MSERKNGDDGIPPIVAMFVKVLMGVHVEDSKTHEQWHRDKIQEWESCREYLNERFGTAVATDLIELQRMAARACAGRHSSLSMLMSAICDLVAVSDGQDCALDKGAGMLHELIGHIADFRKQHEAEEAARKSRPRARKKPGKPKAAPPPQSDTEQGRVFRDEIERN